MNYSITSLTTVADCDALLALVNAESQALNLKQANLNADLQNYSTTSVNVESEIIILTAELTALESYLNILPEGKAKQKAISKKKVAEGRLSVLMERKGNYGLVALINRQLDAGQIESQLTAISAFIAQVEAHKATL